LLRHHFSRGRKILILKRFSLLRSCLLSGLSGLAVALTALPARSSPPEYHPPFPTEIILAQRSIADTSTVRATNPQPAAAPTMSAAADTARADSAATHGAEGSGKSTGLAVGLDLLVPGTGHLYAGYKSGFINLGVEALTWVTYFYYQDQGEAKENEYIAYADQYWSYERWLASGCAVCTPESQEAKLIKNFQETNPQHYYEDIGKLSTYFEGWEDYDDEVTLDSQQRHYYYGMRNDSNNDLKNSRYALMVGFVNRIVATVDILRLMKNRGKVNIGNDTTLKFNMHTKPFSRDNAIGVRVTKTLY